MERRKNKRYARRITCEILTEGHRQTGFVLDASADGLFVKTASPPPPGAEVEVRLRAAYLRTPIVLRAVVSRQRRVPAHLSSVAKGGVGLRLHEAPPAYRRFVEELAGGESARASAASNGNGREAASVTYRVRLRQRQGSRSRSLTVTAGSVEEVEESLAGETASDWEILEIRPE